MPIPIPIPIPSLISTHHPRIERARRRTRTRSVLTTFKLPRLSILPIIRGPLSSDPEIPHHPSHHRPDAAPAHHRHGRDPLLEDADEAADEDDDRADVLHDDGRVRDEGPEFVGQ